MGSTWARTRGQEQVRALAAAGLGDRDLRREVLAGLRDVIDFAAYVWLLTDPVTEVGAAPLAEVPCLAELPAHGRRPARSAATRQCPARWAAGSG